MCKHTERKFYHISKRVGMEKEYQSQMKQSHQSNRRNSNNVDISEKSLIETLSGEEKSKVQNERRQYNGNDENLNDW